VDRRAVSLLQQREAVTLELTLQVAAHDSAVTIDLRQLVFTVDEEEFRPTEVWVNNPERERQVFNGYITARRQSPPTQQPPLPRSSDWRDPITAPTTIRPGEESPRFLVTFPIPPPSPERTLSLDLSRAIESPMHAGKTVVRFKLMRWSEGYS